MPDNTKPEISFTVSTPYIAKGLERLEDRHGKKYPANPVMALCRCGESGNKPFCDGSHTAKGINGEKAPDRTPYVWKNYKGKKITVHFNPGVCSHDGSCIKAAPSVFNKEKRPWINPDQAEPEEIIEAIKQCPSGALSYTIEEEHKIERYEGEPLIRASKKGPIEVYGGIKIKDDRNTCPEREDSYVLCGCGHSKNKPFCDGHHLEKIKNETK